VSITARWVADRRDLDPEVVGAGLVTAYDRVFERHDR
jgi:endonuclease YncB( thermonuclease family)